MSTQAERIIRIAKDGRQVAVSEADYKHRKMAALGGQTYQEAGYTVVSFEDGLPYDGEPSKYAINSNLRTNGIGEKVTNPTDIDGNAVSADYARAAGVDVVQAAVSPRRTADVDRASSVSASATSPVPAPSNAQS